MKKNIGGVLGLYPTPVTVVGTVVNNNVNWINIAHVGIIGVDRILISSHKSHFSNQGIKKHMKMSINLVNEALLEAADYVGIYSGKQRDKSEVFSIMPDGDPFAPVIESAPLSMVCEVVDIYDSGQHDNFIVKPIETYVEEAYLTDDDKIDFEKMSLILFEMAQRTYLKTGDRVGACWQMGRDYFEKSETVSHLDV